MGNKVRKMGKNEIYKHYDIKEKLGTGSFATVKRAIRRSDGREFAIKIIKKDKLNSEEIAVVHDEVEIMHKIEHPNCVQLYEMFETKTKLYMVIELLTGGELFDRIVAKGSYSEKEGSELIKCITQAIKYLHGIGVVHRDLKPENLIYASSRSDSAVKITDFGLAKFRGEPLHYQRGDMHTACGTPGYVAPEVLKGAEGQGYGPAVDMWSLGVILYILLCGFPPFYHESTAALYKQIKKGQYEFPDPYWSDISKEAKHLVSRLLTVDPKKRITPDGVLTHEWIAGDAAPDKAFSDGHSERFRMLQARRILRRGVRTIIAVNRFSRQLQYMLESD
jgi:calcium/calmodulin-dependent protein kinase I